MKSRRFRNFVKKTELLVHIRSRKYHPQTIGREERYHGSLKLEHLYRVLPYHRTELVEAVSSYRRFYNYERLHNGPWVLYTGYGVFNKGRSKTLTYKPAKVVPN